MTIRTEADTTLYQSTMRRMIELDPLSTQGQAEMTARIPEAKTFEFIAFLEERRNDIKNCIQNQESVLRQLHEMEHNFPDRKDELKKTFTAVEASYAESKRLLETLCIPKETIQALRILASKRVPVLAQRTSAQRAAVSTMAEVDDDLHTDIGTKIRNSHPSVIMAASIASAFLRSGAASAMFGIPHASSATASTAATTRATSSQTSAPVQRTTSRMSAPNDALIRLNPLIQPEKDLAKYIDFSSKGYDSDRLRKDRIRDYLPSLVLASSTSGATSAATLLTPASSAQTPSLANDDGSDAVKKRKTQQ